MRRGRPGVSRRASQSTDDDMSGPAGPVGGESVETSRLAPVALIIIIGQIFDRTRLFVPAMTSEDPFAHSFQELPGAVWPDAIDIVFMVGWFALAALAYIWAARRFPIHSGWELREGAMLRKERKYMRTEVLVLGKPD